MAGCFAPVFVIRSLVHLLIIINLIIGNSSKTIPVVDKLKKLDQHTRLTGKPKIPFIVKYETLIKIDRRIQMQDEKDRAKKILSDRLKYKIETNDFDVGDKIRGLHHCFSLELDHGKQYRVLCHRGATTGFDSKSKLKFRMTNGRIEEGDAKDYVSSSIEGVIDAGTNSEMANSYSYVLGWISSSGIFEGLIATGDSEEDITYFVEPMVRYFRKDSGQLGRPDSNGYYSDSEHISIVYKATDIIICPEISTDEDLQQESIDETFGVSAKEPKNMIEHKDSRDWYIEHSDTALPELENESEEDEAEETPRRRWPLPTVIYDISATVCSIDGEISYAGMARPISEPNEPRFKSKGNLGKICRLKVLMDHSGFDGHSLGDRQRAISTVQIIVDAVDRAFRKIDFDGDDHGDGYRVKIGELEVIQSTSDLDSYLGLSSSTADPDQFLDSIGNDELDGFCLGVVFTDRNLQGTLGRAYQATPDRNELGGICSKGFKMNDGTKSHRNTLFLTFNREGQIVPLAAARVVAAHLFGHSWGARHDSQCRMNMVDDGRQQMKYIMDHGSRDSERQTTSHRWEFSKCSIEDMAEVIKRKATCLK